MKKLRIGAMASLALTLAPSVWADPISVTGGIVVGYGRGAFRTLSFSLEADQVSVGGVQGDGTSQPGFFPPCTELAPCAAGATTSPSGTLTVNAIGSATLDGTAYDLTQYFGGVANIFTFSAGDVTIPGGVSDTLALTTPFTFAGLLDVFALDAGSQWSYVRSLNLTGQGVATVNFRRTSEGYAIQNVDYQLTNLTPEPASLLLLATGLAMVMRARIARRVM